MITGKLRKLQSYEDGLKEGNAIRKKKLTKTEIREISLFYQAKDIYKINNEGATKNERLKIIGMISLG